jgi:hypothetical protein
MANLPEGTDDGGLGLGGRPSVQVFRELRRHPDWCASGAPTTVTSSGRSAVDFQALTELDETLVGLDETLGKNDEPLVEVDEPLTGSLSL